MTMPIVIDVVGCGVGTARRSCRGYSEMISPRIGVLVRMGVRNFFDRTPDAPTVGGRQP
ncbi:MAG: hypothetical protein K5821_15065 [Nitrobacter sp.]|uniref:hypothetical protein n=1 Tax=Nitrobacter sp. TaxID=29420 RepID=UPI00261EEDD6|nr:hypothetical protein [Nitrobacter sp.]MCV0387709.1 hypothetical protein [Nitrobacter sp.]